MTSRPFAGSIRHRRTIMALALLAIAFQLQTASLGGSAVVRQIPARSDSAQVARRARDAQAAFERTRRSNLPWEGRSGDRCEVRLGRFCWWYDEIAPPLPPENETIVARRAAFIAELDSMATLHPGDEWLAGMRVHYRVDARRLEAADSAARGCQSTRWWCDALMGYAAHVLGDARRADSSFTAAFAGMDEETRCHWSDIHMLLPSDSRERYEELSCAERAAMDRRYWLLARPRLAAPANELRNEFFTRRVQGWLAERSRTPQPLSWGKDAEELLLRYGWPVTWGRVEIRSGASFAPEANVVGHDPSPSFSFGAREELLDSLVESSDDGWDLRSHYGESRFAPIGVKRIAHVAVQLARFRRGDSTLLVAAYAARDDSLGAPVGQLAAAVNDTLTMSVATDSSQPGRARLLLPSAPRLAGVEMIDSTTHTFARSRRLFAPAQDGARLSLSDLLIHRIGTEPASDLDSALALAIPGDTVGRDRPLGIFWETYGLAKGGESVDVAVTVQRIDRSWFRSTRQALGLADEDTPLRMRWTDAQASPDGIATHAVSLDLANLPAGRYRLTLSLTPAGAEPVVASRDIQLREP
jgi:hypothetical protein